MVPGVIPHQEGPQLCAVASSALVGEQILGPSSSQEIPECPSLDDPSGKLVLVKVVPQRCWSLPRHSLKVGPWQGDPSKKLVLAKVAPQRCWSLAR